MEIIMGSILAVILIGAGIYGIMRDMKGESKHLNKTKLGMVIIGIVMFIAIIVRKTVGLEAVGTVLFPGVIVGVIVILIGVIKDKDTPFS